VKNERVLIMEGNKMVFWIEKAHRVRATRESDLA
jgi:hypothetical protein